MRVEFQPNGYIQQLIDQHGPNSKEVVKAIEFWGPEAGEFALTEGFLAVTDEPETVEGKD